MKIFTRVLALVLVGIMTTNVVKPLTENEAVGYTIASGLVTAAIAGGITYYCMDDATKKEAGHVKKVLIALAVGGGTGTILALILYYAILADYTPSGRLAAAQQLVNDIQRNGLTNADDVLAYAAGHYNIRWPLALAHEECLQLLEKLNSAQLKLNLAMPDVRDELVRAEIQRLLPTILPLINTAQQKTRTIQGVPQYEVQAILLDGHRREERIRQEAEQRHREAMAQQERLHREAMRQQERLLRDR